MELYICRWYWYVLWHEVLQRSINGSWAIWKRSVGGASPKGQEHIYFKAGMGISSQSLLQWRWMRVAPTWCIPLLAQFCPAESICRLNIDLLIVFPVDSYLLIGVLELEFFPVPENFEDNDILGHENRLYNYLIHFTEEPELRFVNRHRLNKCELDLTRLFLVARTVMS